jgi:hypothetical protein
MLLLYASLLAAYTSFGPYPPPYPETEFEEGPSADFFEPEDELRMNDPMKPDTRSSK